jgi:PadR family transcriptional regulator PadR
VNLKGSLPLLILHTLRSRAQHGYQIAQDIKRRSAGVLDFKEGTLYPTLHNLEQQGYIESYSETENGRVRRYYRLTERGLSQQDEQLAEWKRFSDAVQRVLGEGNA